MNEFNFLENIVFGMTIVMAIITDIISWFHSSGGEWKEWYIFKMISSMYITVFLIIFIHGQWWIISLVYLIVTVLKIIHDRDLQRKEKSMITDKISESVGLDINQAEKKHHNDINASVDDERLCSNCICWIRESFDYDGLDTGHCPSLDETTVENYGCVECDLKQEI